jgi:hypothetical protein
MDQTGAFSVGAVWVMRTKLALTGANAIDVIRPLP